MTASRPIAFFLGLPLALGLALASVAGAVADEIPPRPEFGVLDSASLFPLPALKATERLVAEHERLTQERISFVTRTDIPEGRLAEEATRIFEEWSKTAPRPPNAVLVLVDAANGDVEIHPGIGVDPVLSAPKRAEIRKRFFRAEWKYGQKSRAVVLTFVEVLRGLGSPLMDEDEATTAFEQAGFAGGWEPVAPPERSWIGWIFAGFGLAVAAFVLARILIGETHYTEEGWHRVPATKSLRRLFPNGRKTPTLVTGGGVSGRY